MGRNRNYVEDVHDLEDLDHEADHLVLDLDHDQDLAPGEEVTKEVDPNLGAAVDPHHQRIVPVQGAEAQAQNVIDHVHVQEIVPIKIKMVATANLATDLVLDLDRVTVDLDPDLDLVVPKMIETNVLERTKKKYTNENKQILVKIHFEYYYIPLFQIQDYNCNSSNHHSKHWYFFVKKTCKFFGKIVFFAPNSFDFFFHNSFLYFLHGLLQNY